MYQPLPSPINAPHCLCPCHTAPHDCQTYLFYVNHKCVPLGDKSSTHQKALDLFLTRVGMPLSHVAALKVRGHAPCRLLSIYTPANPVDVLLCLG